ncbi:MAG: hypothetical protein EAY75_01770 [Bacteroidetes bacterium]|nr:MAG: hypothetical protein EAY75_01770 [Bacteroidota bacterium]
MLKDQKKTFVLRLDAKTYALIEKWAADEFRSVNGQLEYVIHKALKDAGRLAKETGQAEKKDA